MLPDGRCVTQISELPSAVDLAGNDIVKRNFAIGDMKAQREALDKQIAEAEGDSGIIKPKQTKSGKAGKAADAAFEAELSGIVSPEEATAIVGAGFDSKENLKASFVDVDGEDLPESVSNASKDKLRDFVNPIPA